MFRDRPHAGEVLAELLRDRRGDRDQIILGLPRGGMPVAYEVARRLQAPLDVFIVRKLGFPGHPELAMGAIASGNVRVLNAEVVGSSPAAAEMIEEITKREEEEIRRREREYRDDRPAPELTGRSVILVDDGLATGATMRAAISALRLCAAGKITVAVPVGPPETCRELAGEVDQLVCAFEPAQFYAVGEFYEDFAQTTDEEVRRLLARAAAERAAPGK